MTEAFSSGDRCALAELAPVLRRAADLSPTALARIRVTAQTATVLVRLPFGVLISRTVEAQRAQPDNADHDVTVRAADTVLWLDDQAAAAPQRRDAEWRAGLPPRNGWRRIETVPDDVIRSLVRQGALALKAAAEREGVPGAQPRAQVADALLDSTVLTVADDNDNDNDNDDNNRTGNHAEVTLRALSALTRMGFLPRGAPAHIDTNGRWIRVVGGYGTVYLERPGSGLGLLTR